MHKNTKLLFRILALCLCFVLATPLFPVSSAAEKVVFVSNKASGNGSSASSPVGTLADALSKLGSNGGTIVVCGKVDVSANITVPTHKGKITITSLYDGVDYRKETDAALIFTANMNLGGPTEFCELTFRCSVANGSSSSYPYKGIFACGNDLTMGAGLKSELVKGCMTHLSVMGGSSKAYLNVTQNIEFNSGTWQRVRCGATKAGSRKYNINITVNGGSFKEKLILGSGSASGTCSHNGDINAVLNGGEFHGGVYLSAFHTTGDLFDGNVTVTLNGGTVYGVLGVACQRKGVFKGSYTLNINGGDYGRITHLDGTEELDGTMTSTLVYGDGVDPAAPLTGTTTFKNYLCTAADPFMFYHDGNYYLTSTGSTSIGIACAANIADIGNTTKVTVFTAPSGYKNTWSPEIHHFTDEEIGAGNGGWYMFLGMANENDLSEGETSASRQREYVLKCLDGDFLLGRWGHPVTGEVNQPMKVGFKGGTDYNDLFCGGMSILRVNGKVYMTFVSEIGRGTSEFHQTINITTIENPWTITGDPVVICKPDYAWEMHGYAQSSSDKNKWWPKVVEGCSAVYGKDGSTYLIYTGSGYWTTWYALGYMKYMGGDPLSPSAWKKNPDPILQRTSTLNKNSINGCGHGSYFDDAEGNTWVCYHGYVGTNTDSGRFAFAERIYVSNDRVYVGNDTGHPAPLTTEYTMNINPTPVGERAKGFTTVKDSKPVTEPPVTEPPVTEPPVTEPPVTEPPVTEPPVTEPPATEPPATEPPATEPPATEPPATEPPVTEPPVTEPPATEPPATEPPATEPPATEPPVTEPPVTEPPATEPPVTEPPVTEPPATEPPTTEPPITVPPKDDGINYLALGGISVAALAAVAVFIVLLKKKK